MIPEDVQVALKLGSSIRPGMVPISRIVCLGEDDQDRFSHLQQTVLPEGLDSITFYNAKVKTDQKAYGSIRRAWWRAACIINALNLRRTGVDQGYDKPIRP